MRLQCALFDLSWLLFKKRKKSLFWSTHFGKNWGCAAHFTSCCDYSHTAWHSLVAVVLVSAAD